MVKLIVQTVAMKLMVLVFVKNAIEGPAGLMIRYYLSTDIKLGSVTHMVPARIAGVLLIKMANAFVVRLIKNDYSPGLRYQWGGEQQNQNATDQDTASYPERKVYMVGDQLLSGLWGSAGMGLEVPSIIPRL